MGNPREPLTDELIGLAKGGDQGAWCQIYDLCYPRVLRVVLPMVGDESSDVVQQVFLKIFRGLSQFRGDSSFETWLHRVAVNEALQHLRRKERHDYKPLSHEPIDKKTAQGASNSKELISQALQQIAPDLRAIFLLREVEKLSYAEIAGVLEIPEGTVGSRLNNARNQLRTILAELID